MFGKGMDEETEMEAPEAAPEQAEASGGMRSKLLKQLIEMLMQMPDAGKEESEGKLEAPPKEMC